MHEGANPSAPVLLDGPMGTELERRGQDTRLPLWSARALRDAPEVVEAIHRDYAMAGATVHTTNTFRTRPRTLGSNWAELARRAVRLARRAVPPTHRIAGSIAPIEDCYRPDQSPGEAARQAHASLADVLADAGCDLLLCETFPHVGEALAATRAAAATGVETWTALTAGPNADLLTPAAMAEGAKALVGAGAAAVLVNCTPAQGTLRFVEALRAAVEVPIGAYGNAGCADDAIGWNADADLGAAAYAALAKRWRDAGASLIGSCCGTGVAHVAALSQRFER